MLLERLYFAQSGLATEAPSETELPAMLFNRIHLHSWVLAAVAADLIGTIVSPVVIFGACVEPIGYGTIHLWAGLGGFIIAWGLASHSQGLYDRRTMFAGRRELLRRAAATCVLAFGIILLLAFGLKMISGVSRLWLLGWAASALLWVVAARFVFQSCLLTMLRHGGCLSRALVLAGSLHEGRRSGEAVEDESGGQIRIAAVALMPGIPGAPSYEAVEAAVRADLIDRVFIADFNDAVPQTNTLLARLAQLAVDVTLLPNFNGLRAPLSRVAQIGTVPAVDVACRPLSSVQAAIKRTEDLVLAGTILLVISPVLLLIALAVKSDSRGPLLFRQVRLGFHDQTFRVWKFRTMYHDATSANAGGLRQTGRNDDRVTRVGRLLRRTSLDELPQLFNVLRGEMSIVGPRPHAQTMTTAGRPLHALLQSYASRHRIKPGITGWAQINGCRGEVNTEKKLRERVALDCHYIENWSVALDAWIILRTVGLVFSDPDAY